MSFGTCTRCFGAEVEQKRENGQAGLRSFSVAWPGSFLLGTSCAIDRHWMLCPKVRRPALTSLQSRRLLCCSVGCARRTCRALRSFALPAQPVTKRQHICPEQSSALKESGDSKCNSSGDRQSLEKAAWTVNLVEAGPESVKPLDTAFVERDHGKALGFCGSSTL